MKKILFVQPKLEGVGGIEKVVPEVSSFLNDNELVVNAFVLYGEIPAEQKFWQNVSTLKEGQSRGLLHKAIKSVARIMKLRNFVSKTKSEVLIVSAQGIAVLVLLGKKLGLIKIPVIVYVHENLNVSGKMYYTLIKLLYRKADGFISVSQGIKDELESELKIEKGRSILVYNSIPPAYLTAIRNPVSGEYQEPVFVTASRLERIKGVDILVSNFIRYAKENSGTLLILGSGSLEKDLQEKVKASGLGERIVFLGAIDNVRPYLDRAVAYLSLAPSESFGLSLLEAMAREVPLVATDVPYGPREIMNVTRDKVLVYPYRNNYGYLLTSFTENGKDNFYQHFSIALNKVKNNTFSKTKMRERAQFFSVEKQATPLLALIDTLIEHE